MVYQRNEVKIWFQNRRSKCKKIMKHTGPGATGQEMPQTPSGTAPGQTGMSPPVMSPGLSPGAHSSHDADTPTPMQQQQHQQQQMLPQHTPQQQHHHHHQMPQPQQQTPQQHTNSLSHSMLAHSHHLPHHDSMTPPTSSAPAWIEIPNPGLDGGVPGSMQSPLPPQPSHTPNTYATGGYLPPHSALSQYPWYPQSMAPPHHQASLLT